MSGVQYSFDPEKLLSDDIRTVRNGVRENFAFESRHSRAPGPKGLVTICLLSPELLRAVANRRAP